MRSAGNFSPEWGYLAPAPSFARTARVVLVATAIGATAGAGVVLSLVDRPSEPETTAIAARAIVTSVRAPAPSAITPATIAEPAPVAAPARAASPPASVAAAPGNRKLRTAAHGSSREASLAAPTAAPASPGTTAAVSPNTAAPAVQTTSAPPADAATAASAAPAPASPEAAEQAKLEAARAEAADSGTIIAPEQPAKTTKRHSKYPGIGSIFRRMFAAHGGGRSYYPTSQLP